MKINAQDKDQATPLHLVSYESRFAIVQELLDRSANIDPQNADGQTPLHRASQCLQYGDYASQVIPLFLERGADVNSLDKDQATSLNLASYHRLADVVEVLHGHPVTRHRTNPRTSSARQLILGDHHYQNITTSPRSQENYQY